MADPTQVANQNNQGGNNPLSETTEIVVILPKSIKIRLVDAGILSAYEVWFFLSGITTNFVAGAWVWYGQNKDENLKAPLLFISIFQFRAKAYSEYFVNFPTCGIALPFNWFKPDKI